MTHRTLQIHPSMTQADGHGSDTTPTKNDASALLNEALQIFEFHRRRLQMSMGEPAARALEDAIVGAKRELDAERAARREVVALAMRQSVAAPDPAHVAMLAQMEQTNRELGLTGDALVAHLQVEGLDR